MSQGSITNTVSADVEWAFDAVETVSRTFALSIAELERPFSTWICTGYLLCRVADTIEDAGHIPPETQVSLLELYDAVLDGDRVVCVDEFVSEVSTWVPEDGGSDWDVVMDTARIVRVFESFDAGIQGSMRPVVREMISGMVLFIDRYADTDGLRIETIEELKTYCWYVAGTVGEMITNLLEGECDVDSGVLRKHEESFALLLQLVNIAKDVPDDYHVENNVYLPSEWLSSVGVDSEDVMDAGNTKAVARVVLQVTDRAQSCTDGAYEYLCGVSETDTNMFQAFSIPYLLAIGTLRELEANAERAVSPHGDVKISREEVFAVLGEIHDEFSTVDLREMQEIIERTPLQNATVN